jgi:lactate dehydrogenase-like 2-hydroxyacid dehydrogenase
VRLSKVVNNNIQILNRTIMSKVRVAFNGMGRIGKNVMRVIVEQFNDQIVIFKF